MKIKDGLMLRRIAEQWIVVPLGNRTIEFNAIMTLSDTGAFIWDKLVNGTVTSNIVSMLCEEYEVDFEIAKNDVSMFITELTERGMLE